jgi:hypothetical protein
MRFNEKCAEYCKGAGPLQVGLRVKKLLLSSEVIVDRKMRTVS